ncbi:MAG: ABC transporter permease [Bacilli bacterium]|nr:ABC transporter permease [Bacilli bacterium]
MAYFIQQTMVFCIPLMIVALAGVFAERSGIINIALEGIMVFGAFIGVLTLRLLLALRFGPEQGQLLLIIVIIVTIIMGGVFALLLAYASINLKADQTIGGTALNLLAPALVLFLVLMINQQNDLNIDSKYTAANLFMFFLEDFGLEAFKNDTSFLGVIVNVLFNKLYLTNLYAILIYVGLSIVLYKTKFGLRLRACGENPHAADSLGINVVKMRYIGTIISGCLASFGGFIYALTAAGCTSNGDVAGLGFLALAVMIFGNWKPVSIFLAALLFGALKCISVGYQYIDFLSFLTEWNISSHAYRVLPYFITLVVLAFTSKRSRAPKAEGIPYDKEARY